MIRDDVFNWAMMAAVVIWVMVWLSACAGPEPAAPISYYREIHGFTP